MRITNIVVPLALAAVLVGCGDNKEKANVNASGAAAVTAEQTSSAPDSSSPVADESIELHGRDAGKAISDYLVKAQRVMTVDRSLQQVQLSQVKQALQFGDLDKYRSAAATLKDSAMKEQEEIERIEHPNLSDSDGKYLDDIDQAISDTIGVQVDLAVDVATGADTGLETLDSKEISDLAHAKKKAAKSLSESVHKAYMHFGYKSSEINWKTFTIKK